MGTALARGRLLLEDRVDGVFASHLLDELFIGDRLVVEISPSKGVVVFNTAGFAEARAEYCSGKEQYPSMVRG